MFRTKTPDKTIIDFENNVNYVHFDITTTNIFLNMILSRSKDIERVSSKSCLLIKKFCLNINLSCLLTASLYQKNNFWLITAVNAGALTVPTFSQFFHDIFEFLDKVSQNLFVR